MGRKLQRVSTALVLGAFALAAAACEIGSFTGSSGTDIHVPPPGSNSGLWMSAEELAALPTSGEAWSSLEAAADESCGTPRLDDQDDEANVCVMAKALVFARIGGAQYRDAVVEALRAIANSGTYGGRALALGRELIAYVIAADLVALSDLDPALDEAFRNRLAELRVALTSDGPLTLQACHEERPNNWGNHCGASLAAVAAYLGDDVGLDRVAAVFRGYLGDRSAYAGFNYGSDLSWQADPDNPVGINPAGATKDGHMIDGVLPDDQRRCGPFQWPPCETDYAWEGLQGAVAMAWILHRQGYPAFEWSDAALYRAVSWLYSQGMPAVGDDTWQPHLINWVYGTDFPAPVPARSGKNVGWTDWTHDR